MPSKTNITILSKKTKNINQKTGDFQVEQDTLNIQQPDIIFENHG